MSKSACHDPVREQAVALYSQGLLIREVAELLSLKPSTVRSWISKAGISRHRGPASGVVNEDYFDYIDTEDKAYWLGWLMADSCISVYNGQYSLKIHIAIKDRILIDTFLRFIRSSNKPCIKQYRGCTSYYVSLTSRHMVEALIRHGVVQSKSARCSIPDIPQDLVRHFVRGYFDGDGTIETHGKQRRAGITGHPLLLEQILDMIIQSHPLERCPKIYPSTGTSYFLISRRHDLEMFYDYLYGDATIWLPRKRDAFVEALGRGNAEVTIWPKNQMAP